MRPRCAPDHERATSKSLKSLRDRPFELLAELERRGRAVSAQVSQEAPPAANGWAWRCAWRGTCTWWRARRRAKCSACRPASRACRAPSPGSKGSPTCAASCCRSSTCASSSAAASRRSRATRASWWSTTARFPRACWWMRCSASGASPKASSPAMRRRPWRAASAIWPAPSAARSEQWPVLSLRSVLESPAFAEAAA